MKVQLYKNILAVLSSKGEVSEQYNHLADLGNHFIGTKNGSKTDKGTGGKVFGTDEKISQQAGI